MKEPLEPLDSLDIAFELPENIADPKLRTLYEILVSRMRQEARHMAMNTVQNLFIERIAYNYIVLRMKERLPAGDPDGFAHANQQKEYNDFWLKCATEFNRMMRVSDSDYRDAVMKEVRDIIITTLQDVPDVNTREMLVDRFAESFRKAGI
jgi:hypothetical protein